MSRETRIRRILALIEKTLNEPIPGTPNISRKRGGNPQGRVMYVALPGSKKKTQMLSHRAQQVMGQINRKGRITAAALMSALEVNRNVIAGAVHELKQAGFLGTEPAMASGAEYQTAAEHQPRKRKTSRRRSK